MKLIVLISTLVLSHGLWAGDLGGGGSIGLRVSHVVDDQTIFELKQSQNLNEAYFKWVKRLSEEQRKQVFEQAFEDYVLPQLTHTNR